MEQQTPPLVPLESEPKYSFCQWFFDTSAEVGRILIPPPRECTRSVWSSAFRRPFERRSSSRVNAELQTGGGSKMRPAVVAPRRPMAAGVSSVPGSWSQQSDENEEDNWIHGEPLSLWHMHWDSEPMGDPPHPSSGHALPHWGVTV